MVANILVVSSTSGSATTLVRPMLLPPKRSLRFATTKATSSSNTSQSQPPPEPPKKSAISAVLDVPRAMWRRTLQPLGDFGFGRRSVWEGGVGLFVASGAALAALSLMWLRGFQLRSRYRKYQAVVEFSQACGICVGTPVRIRGVTVGSVVHVDSSVRSVDAVVEIEDDKTIIPRNSTVEVNQSGLLMETLIDITPRDPLPTPSLGPLDPDCRQEGLIVCNRERIKGKEGVSLDALVGIFTRIGREVEEIGVKRSYELAKRVASIVQEAQPLIAKIEVMAEDIQPLLSEVCDSSLLKDVENLTKNLAVATEDLRKVHSSILTSENTDLIRQSIFTLIFTLRNIESISSDISGFTGDEATRRNLKVLIKSLSRLL
ncbi:protein TRIGALACTOSYLDIACYLGLYCEROL 2, chloroplastic [Iris pallida]|uniref:Protein TRIGALACTOSYLDIACYLGLYCEROL 2, chloroplastic n=1 Tax=Iris pallida TaxID=29817 RepID=A0AAX6FXA1_IRIPA|nr:protein TRIGALACTOSYLDIACYLGLYCEROL 2, chloroplastic [Iris pallida]